MQLARIVFLAVLPALNAVALPITTKKVDAVRQKTLLNQVLDNTDFEVIDAFWSGALAEMLILDDASEIVNIRNQILERRGGGEPSQYSVSFITSAKKHLTAVFDELQSWEGNGRKTGLERNLIILTAQLESSELLEPGIRMTGHENGIIRYWAVKALTNFDFVRQLNADTISDTGLIDSVFLQLETAAEKESHPEILSLIATFASRVNKPQAKQLLTKIVDLRISAYENWTVKYELMDARLLKSLGNEILSPESAPNKAANSRRFAQLYSYAMQRFILGKDVLSNVSKQRLASVLVEIDRTVLDRLLGRTQSAITKTVEKILTRKTVEQKDYSALEAEHDALLGDAARKGDLPAALNFDYGKGPDGSAVTSPKKLGPPPENQPETKAAESETEVTEPETEAAGTIG
jgi:hypothetical protein